MLLPDTYVKDRWLGQLVICRKCDHQSVLDGTARKAADLGLMANHPCTRSVALPLGGTGRDNAAAVGQQAYRTVSRLQAHV